MRVSEAMHKNLTWVSPGMPLSEVAGKMKEEDIGAVPVSENDRLIGMVTDRDLAIRAFADGRDVSSMTARDVMSPGITTCRGDQTLEEAARIMERRQIRRLPVVDEEERLIGMLSIGDVSHYGDEQLTGEVIEAVSGHHS